MPPQQQPPTQYERIEQHCKYLWGDFDYDINTETDDYQTYLIYVKKDFGTYFGPILAGAGPCRAHEIWNELERQLSAWVRAARGGRPLTREESISLAAGPRGEFKALMESVYDFKEMWEARKAAGRS